MIKTRLRHTSIYWCRSQAKIKDLVINYCGKGTKRKHRMENRNYQVGVVYFYFFLLSCLLAMLLPIIRC